MHAYYEPYWMPNYQKELEHFGIKGMKWGIRRYQNSDGTLTEAGKQRYGTVENLQVSRERSKARQKAVGNAAKKVAKTAVKTTVMAAKLGAVGIGAMAVISLFSSPEGQQLMKLGSNAMDGYFMGQAKKNSVKVITGNYSSKADELVSKWMVEQGKKSFKNQAKASLNEGLLGLQNLYLDNKFK